MKKTILIIIGLLISINIIFASCNNKATINEDKQTKIADNKNTIENNLDQVVNDTNKQISNLTYHHQTYSGNNPWDNIKPKKVNILTTQGFKELIFDYTNSNQWNYKGQKPCVIDFYADWCRPCRYVAPIMEELAEEYNGNVIFFKVNVDNEKELAQVFGIQSIPSVLFCPSKGSPQMAIGAMKKENYIRAIKEITGVTHP